MAGSGATTDAPSRVAGVPARGAFRHPSRGLALLLGLLLILVVISPLLGSPAIPPGETLRILSHQLTGGAYPASPCVLVPATSVRCAINIEIIWDIRLPAILLAVIAGGSLGIAGGTLQGVFRNPLADPYLLGLSAGAALGASTLFVLGVGIAEANYTLPLFAFLGALGTGLVVLLAARARRSTSESLLLTGVALSSFLTAVLSVLLLYNPVGNLQVSFWLLGGLAGADWNRDAIAFGGTLAAGSVLALHGRELNLLQLGPDVAQSLGVDARAVRARLLLLASLTTAVTVAFTGIIGFVGLMSPHIVRRLLGSDYRVVLPGAALVGGIFLVLANNLAQVIIPVTQVPIGVPTAFAGFPFFIYLLYRRRRPSYRGARA